MENQSNGFLKVSGILLIIGGSISAFMFFSVLGRVSKLNWLNIDTGSPVLFFSMIFMLICTVTNLLTGIEGVKNSAKPEKANICIILGIITICLRVVDAIFGIISGHYMGSIYYLILGLIIPVIYLIGAYWNKKIYTNNTCKDDDTVSL